MKQQVQLQSVSSGERAEGPRNAEEQRTTGRRELLRRKQRAVIERINSNTPPIRE